MTKLLRLRLRKKIQLKRYSKPLLHFCTKVDSMDNEIQKLKTNEDNLKSKASQQHDYKNAELHQSKDEKNPELKGDDGKLLKTHNVCLNTAADQLMIYSNSRELKKVDMDEVQRWILSLLKPEERPMVRALKAGFILTELLTRYCKLIGHKYPDRICSKYNGEDNIISDANLE
ncbi:hypothetical protein H5410_004105 [Solanum commersonii]|uniref:Uncharacterized protein n=1 Tax=Solanum commersonii TaxID=4109 RepID=A0A9J6B756_SOLCO|nr:hypothetical protein H5410_004105 [Solanum commersonii]